MTWSSKGAAFHGSKEQLLDVLQFILDKGNVDKALGKKLRYARRQHYVVKKGDLFALTPKGAHFLVEGKIWEITIPKPNRWDGKWHIVVFDIPADKRKRRDSFRRRLQELGLALYQNSVWIYPYPLEREVKQIADFYMLSQCVSFIVADELSHEHNLMKRFNLT